MENRGPLVIAMRIWNRLRSGYQSPMVADTDGNHSSGYPATPFLTIFLKCNAQPNSKAEPNATSARYVWTAAK